MKLKYSAMMALGAVLPMQAAEEKAPDQVQHSFIPKAFYRIHKERGYNYQAFGMGMEYQYEKSEGVNVKFAVLTTPFTDELLLETEGTFFYKFALNDSHFYYPIFSNRFDSHRIHKEGDRKWVVSKQTIFAGLGWQYNVCSFGEVHVRLQGFRDMHNMYIITTGNELWMGRAFTNPYGARASLGIKGKWGDNQCVELEGCFSKTFEEYYTQVGCSLSYTWGF